MTFIPSKMPHGGMGKLVEELNEVGQVAGKFFTLGHLGDHWDGTNLKERLEDELGDCLAAMYFVIIRHALDPKRIDARRIKKLELFKEWDRA